MYVRDIVIVIITLAILLDFFKYISYVNDRLYNHMLSQFKITVNFHHITAKHSRSDIYEIDPFQYSGTRMS